MYSTDLPEETGAVSGLHTFPALVVLGVTLHSAGKEAGKQAAEVRLSPETVAGERDSRSNAVVGSMSRWWGSAAALAAMFFTVEALYTLHQETASFNEALSACRAEGFLTSMASEEEKEHILSSVSASLKSAGSFDFWLGLRKPVGTCNRDDLPLRGFVWTLDNSSASEVSQWRRTPFGTCTNELCGLLSLDFDGGKVTDWGWADSRCSRAHNFICKSRPGGTSSPDLAEDRPQPPSKPPPAHTVLPSPHPSLPHSPEKERIPPTPSPGSSVTSSSSVIKEIQESTADKYSIFIPVLVALLVLVVLVVVVLVILKCCFKKRPKKEAPQTKNGGKAELTVDLTDTDLDQAETTA